MMTISVRELIKRLSEAEDIDAGVYFLNSEGDLSGIKEISIDDDGDLMLREE